MNEMMIEAVDGFDYASYDVYLEMLADEAREEFEIEYNAYLDEVNAFDEWMAAIDAA